MVFHMKTTLNIDDGVMMRLKREASRQRRTMSDLVETALRRFFAEQRGRVDSWGNHEVQWRNRCSSSIPAKFDQRGSRRSSTVRQLVMTRMPVAAVASSTSIRKRPSGAMS